jgi:hypothetical protein
MNKGKYKKYFVGSTHKNNKGEEYEIIAREGDDITINFLPDGPQRTLTLSSISRGEIAKYPNNKPGGKKVVPLETKQQEICHGNVETVKVSSGNPYFYYIFQYEFNMIAAVMSRRGEQFVVDVLREVVGIPPDATLDYLEELAFKDEFKIFYRHLIEADTTQRIIEAIQGGKK